MGQQKGRIEDEKGKKAGKKQMTEKIWEDKIRRYYVYQSTTPHRMYKELITVLILVLIMVNYIHYCINNNYHNHCYDMIIIEIVLITVLINPLITQML